MPACPICRKPLEAAGEGILQLSFGNFSTKRWRCDPCDVIRLDPLPNVTGAEEPCLATSTSAIEATTLKPTTG